MVLYAHTILQPQPQVIKLLKSFPNYLNQITLQLKIFDLPLDLYK